MNDAPNPPTTKGQRTRAEIVRRTADLMNRQGFMAAPVSAVIEVTGIQKGGLYRHFESRDALAFEAFDHAFGQVRDRLLAAVGSHPDACDQLQAMLKAYAADDCDVPLAGGCPIMNSAIEADHAYPALKARARAAMATWHDLLVRILQAGLRAGKVRPGVDPAETASAFIAAVEGGVMLTQLFGDPGHLAAAVRLLSGHIETNLAGAARRRSQPMIYRNVVEAKLRSAFAALNRGDQGPVLAAFGTPVEHVFYGDHALAGTRRDMQSIRAWYARLKAVFPDLHFDIESVAVTGMPWNTTALVEWRDTFTMPDGTRRGNQGVHALTMRWGKVVSLRIFCDTELLGGVLRDMTLQGRVEAGLAPIGEADARATIGA